MSKTVTSKETILLTSKDLVTQVGIQAVNMRGVAQKCGVSVGSIYNYFPSKSDLIIATIESIWTEIMYGSNCFDPQKSFTQSVLALFQTIQTGSLKYPSFFTLHAMSLGDGDKSKGRKAMDRYFAQMKAGLLTSLQQDPAVKKNVFSASFTQADFIEFVFPNILLFLVEEKPDCAYILEVVKRVIY